MLPREMMTVGEARKRINAIKQYSSLGAGFKIAMRDLEIRGAGNILGTAQSGHIVSIGFDLYCQLLKQAVAKLKGEKVRPRLEVVLRHGLRRHARGGVGGALRGRNARQPAPNRRGSRTSRTAVVSVQPQAPLPPGSYIAESQPRIQAYRRLAEVTTQEQLDALRKTWRDRFGPLPEAAENLLVMTEIKLAAAARKITSRRSPRGQAHAHPRRRLHPDRRKISRASPPPTARGRLREMLAMIRSL